MPGVRQGLLFFGEGMAFAEDPPWRRRLCGQEPGERECARQDCGQTGSSLWDLVGSQGSI